MENILLEYQKTIPKSLRIIKNIIHTSFFRKLDILDKIGELSIEIFGDSQLRMFFSKIQNMK